MFGFEEDDLSYVELIDTTTFSRSVLGENELGEFTELLSNTEFYYEGKYGDTFEGYAYLLVLTDKTKEYSIDFDDLELKLSNPQTSLMILCNPHNPIGKIWDKDTLAKIGHLCKKHNVIVLSDEIHFDHFGKAVKLSLAVKDLILHLSRIVYESIINCCYGK